MDIAKIRKKAREQEERAEEKPVSPRDEPVEASVEETPDVPVPEAGLPEVTAHEEEKEHEGAQNAGPEDLPEKEEILELITFSLSGEEFAFRVSDMEEIIKYQSATRVPTLPDYVSGITSLRGKIIPIIDLEKRLKLKSLPSADPVAKAAEGKGSKGKILILSGPRGLIGANIDSVNGVVRFPGGKMLGPPSHMTEEEMAFIEGVVVLDKRFIFIFRTEEILDIGIG